MSRSFRGSVLVVLPAAAAVSVSLRPVPSSRTSRLELRTLYSETLAPVPARMYQRDLRGALLVPAGAIVYQKRRGHHFVTGEESGIELPPGARMPDVGRGLEFRPWTAALELRPGETRQIDACGADSAIVPSDARYLTAWIDREREHHRNAKRFRINGDRAATCSFFERARRV